VLGALAAVLDLDEEALAHVVVHDDLQTVAAAALKLVPGDPLDGVAWILAARPLATETVAAALAVREPGDLPARSAPAIERWAIEHTTRDRRLFLA